MEIDREKYKVTSNHIGPDGESVDRLYGGGAGTNSLRVVNRDYTEYKGNIKKVSIIKKDMSGNNFRSHVYKTDDNRWFDRGGIPIAKPTNVKEEDEDVTQD